MATLKVEGFAELEKALADLSKATGKGVLRRSLVKAAEPMAALAQSMAPDDPETGGFDLKKSVIVGTRLSRAQTKAHRKMFRDDRAAVEVFVGAGPLPQAIQQEFGNKNHAPQAFLRPAWDAESKATLDRLGRILWEELEKSRIRAQRAAARQAGG